MKTQEPARSVKHSFFGIVAYRQLCLIKNLKYNNNFYNSFKRKVRRLLKEVVRFLQVSCMHSTPYPHPAHTTIPTPPTPLSPPRTPHHYPHPACSPLNLPSRTKLCVIRSILKFSARFHETKSVRRFILAQFLLV